MFNATGALALAIWLAVVCACAFLAQHWGRSYYAWGFVTFFFGPLAIMALLAWGRLTPPQPTAPRPS